MGDTTKAYLYNKNRPVLQCEMMDRRVIQINQVLQPEFLPVCLSYNTTVEAVNEWLAARMIPENREGLRKARLSFPEFENYGNMFSLSDQYWFKFRKSESWDDLNFFTNDYQTEIGKIFFTPWQVDESKMKDPSPDMTTNGVLKKAWIKEDGKSFLYKAGSKQFHQEPLSEVLASLMLEKLDIIPFVRYDLVVHGLKLCSKCANFVTSDTEFVPASHIYNREPRPLEESHYDHLMRMCRMFDIDERETRQFITAMIAADSITCNTDRHLGNFGLLRNVETGKFIGFAPLFDSGNSYKGTKKAVRDKKRGPKLFADREQWAMKQVWRRIDREVFEDRDDMLKLVDNYPDITAQQRELISRQITTMEKNARGKMMEDMDIF